MKKTLTAMIGIAALALGSCGGEHDHEKGEKQEGKTAAAYLKGEKKFESFWSAVKAAKLESRFEGGKITVFAPTNDAFAKLADGARVEIMGEEKTAKAFVEFHVVDGAMKLGDLKAGKLKTIGGESLDVEVMQHGDEEPHPHIQGNHMSVSDIEVDNGFVHVMKSVFAQ